MSKMRKMSEAREARKAHKESKRNQNKTLVICLMGIAIALCVCAAMYTIGTGGRNDASNVIGKESSTVIWRGPFEPVTAVYSDDAPLDSSGMDFDVESIRVGKTAGGGDIFSLMRLTIFGDFMADEVSEVKLYLKSRDGTLPAAIRAGYVTSVWAAYELNREQARAIVADNSLNRVLVSDEGDGWCGVVVTDIVRTWLRGDAPIAGFALFGVDGEKESVFYIGEGADDPNMPYMKVSEVVGERPLIYGRFGFSRQPEVGATVEDGGNCLAYALRDKDSIFFDDLGADAEELNRVLGESGLDALVERFAVYVEQYVEAHKDALCISGFRRIDGFDAPIDPKKEYRIALRVGGFAVDEIVGGRLGYDFHLWAQLNDGRWTEKFPQDFSHIIPGTGASISPEKYGWNSSLFWSPKFVEYYKSKAVYFAVTKDTDGFTEHNQTEPKNSK